MTDVKSQRKNFSWIWTPISKRIKPSRNERKKLTGVLFPKLIISLSNPPPARLPNDIISRSNCNRRQSWLLIQGNFRLVVFLFAGFVKKSIVKRNARKFPWHLDISSVKDLYILWSIVRHTWVVRRRTNKRRQTTNADVNQAPLECATFFTLTSSFGGTCAFGVHTERDQLVEDSALYSRLKSMVA